MAFLFEEFYDVPMEDVVEFAHFWVMAHHKYGKYITI